MATNQMSLLPDPNEPAEAWRLDQTTRRVGRHWAREARARLAESAARIATNGAAK